MFTGLVKSLQPVRRFESLGEGSELTVALPPSWKVRIGDSIAVNGACLTMVGDDSELRFQAGFETLAKTNLGALRKDDRVNLERALQFGDRLGGHLVTGHVDGVGAILQREAHGEFELIWFSAAPDLTRQMAPKGSIAVDGISLTLVDVNEDRFRVMLIPHTLGTTTLGFKQPGDPVNLETDLLAKYVHRQLQGLKP